MKQINLQDNLDWLLIRASMAKKQRLMKLAEEYDLTLMQVLTLGCLEPDEAIPMSMISDLLACDPSNVTGIIDRLSVGSYIDRRESTTDRRVKTISLTAKGIALRNELLAKVHDFESVNLDKLSPEEIHILKSLLRKLTPVPAVTRHTPTTRTKSS